MSEEEKYAGTTAIGRLVYHIKGMGADQFSSIARDLAILRFNVDLASVNADQDMSTVFVWEFPDDVTLSSGSWDGQNGKFYTEVAL